jgi:hypothetical protein
MYLFFIDISYLIGLENQSNLLLNHLYYQTQNRVIMEPAVMVIIATELHLLDLMVMVAVAPVAEKVAMAAVLSTKMAMCFL